MGQPANQDFDEAVASPEALEKHLAAWERIRRAKARVHAVLAFMFFIGMAAMLWMFFEYPSKATEAIGAAVAFALAGIVEVILVLSARAEGRTVQTCKEILKNAPRKQP